MRLPGERIKRIRLIQTEKFVVAGEIELVIPPDDPSEPCYDPETVKLLRDIKDHAERGDVEWLAERGKVYAAMEPVCSYCCFAIHNQCSLAMSTSASSTLIDFACQAG